MEVKGVSNNSAIIGSAKVNKAENNPAADPRDKIEISGEAKELNRNESNSQWIGAIRQKVAAGFYNSDEVLNKVSEKILKEFKF